MKRSLVILLSFALFNLCISKTQKYKLEIKNKEGNDQQIVLIPGIFTKITLVLTELESTNFFLEQYKYNITFKDDEGIVAYKKTMILNPKENLVYSNYIGLKCSESEENEVTLNIDIVGYDQNTDKDTLKFEPIKVKINKIKTQIKLDLLLNSIFQQSKNFFRLEDEIFNVDGIEIKLNKISDKFEHKDIKIQSFSDRDTLSKDTPENHGILFDYPFYPKNILEAGNFNFNLQLKSDLLGACFELVKVDFSFDLKTDGLISIDEKVKAAIIYNTQDITPKFDISSNIHLSMYIPVSPVILECKFSLNASVFNEDNKMLSSDEEEEKIYKTVVTTEGKFDINIENLQANGEYYAQCQISNTGGIDKLINDITIKIGDFLDSDIIKKLIPSKDPNATPQCARITFENKEQADNFKLVGPLFCAYYMKEDETLIS